MTAKTITVRVTPELHRQFKLAAVEEQKSMEALLRTWIERYVEHMKGEVK